MNDKKNSADNGLKRFRQLHQNAPVLVDVFNIANPDALPAPFTVSTRNTTNPNENKFMLVLVNKGPDRLVLGGPNRTGLYVNFSDVMAEADIHKISVSIEGTPVFAQPVFPMFALEMPAAGSTMMAATKTIEAPVPAEITHSLTPPPANNQHLGEELVLYIWPQNEIELKSEDSLVVQFENVISDFRPALRFIDISWELIRMRYGTEGRITEPLEGFHQLAIQLERPPDYTEPPFPLYAHWLNNNNLIYTTADTRESVKNTLKFAISNIGLHDFVLDCSKHSRGAPYFELVMVGKKDGDKDSGDFKNAVADSSDLVLAELEEDSPNQELNQLWRVNKRIQGPIVKWEIRPDLDFDFEKAKLQAQKSEKILLGTDRRASLTFTLSNLITKLDEGVALVYFRYYNMPDHDDGQLVLFLEKSRLETGGNLLPQVSAEENKIDSPLHWNIVKVSNEFKTNVFVDAETLAVKNKLTVGSSLELDKNSILFHGTSEIRALDKIIISPGSTDRSTPQKLTISKDGNLGIGEKEPKVKLHVKDGDSGAVPDLSLAYAVFEHSGVYKYISLLCPDNHENGIIFGRKNTKANDAGIYYNLADGTGNGLQFRVGGNKKALTIARTGNIGIGETAPRDKLHVEGDIFINNGKIILQKFFDSRKEKEHHFGISRVADDIHVISKGKIKLDSRMFDPDRLASTTEPGGGLNSLDPIEIERGSIIPPKIFKGKIYKTGETGYIGSQLGTRERPFYKLFCFLGTFNTVIHDLTLAPSDISLKKDVRPLSETLNARDIIQKIEPVSYRRNNKHRFHPENDNDDSLRYGFIANAVQEILPETVSEMDEDGTLCLNYQALNTVLFQAVKDQQKTISNLEQEVTELKQAFASMRAELDALKKSKPV